jgi:hypothetical protein
VYCMVQSGKKDAMNTSSIFDKQCLVPAKMVDQQHVHSISFI